MSVVILFRRNNFEIRLLAIRRLFNGKMVEIVDSENEMFGLDLNTMWLP